MFLVVVDAHSKWLEVEMVPSATSANIIAKLQAMFATHELPQLIASDNGVAFTNSELQEFIKKNGIHHRSQPLPPSLQQTGGVLFTDI